MTYETILLSQEGGCWTLVLNRPERLNGFTARMHEEIADAIGQVERDPNARVLLLTGAGRAFCAGQDLGERKFDGRAPDLGHALEKYYNPLLKRLTDLPLPVVCAVNGVAAGAGVNVAAACDIVVAKASAKFVQAFGSIGLVPDAGGSWHLPRQLGQARAMGFALLGETLSARDAEAWGLIWKAIDDERFDAEVEAIVARLASGPTYGLGQAKALIRGGLATTLEQALANERFAQRRCGRSPDYREGVTAFKEKRPPLFTGAPPT
jgi:2-(1,2-epoxy-1,2-dihydrophenyl)acetyl-CoA isomerase